MRRIALVLALLTLAPRFVWAATGAATTTLTVDPSATSGTTITAADENDRSNDTSTHANAHVHSLSNSTNLGDGAAGNKALCFDAADTTDMCIRFDDTANLILINSPATGTYSQIATISGTSGITGMLQGDGTGSLVATTIGTGLTFTGTTLNADTASATVDGVVELATTAETTTGTDATRAVTPDGLAGSIFGIRTTIIPVTSPTADASTGDGKFYFQIPQSLTGMNLIAVHAQVVTAGTTGTLNVDLARCAAAATGNACSGVVADMLSTNLTVDSAENHSGTAAAAAVIDAANDDVATNQVIRVDIDAVHTTKSKGLIVALDFQLP